MRGLRSGRLLVLLVLALAAFSVAGCGGSGNATTRSSPPLLVSPGEFEQAVAEPSRVTINVHVPDEGSIPGTDRSIPFDEIEVRQAELPDPSTPLAVYCRSGRMSAIAVETLAKLGFDDVVELQGGMKAWAGAGKPILPPGSG